MTCGSEKLCHLLRAMVSIEIACNLDFYIDHPYLTKKQLESETKFCKGYLLRLSMHFNSTDDMINTEASLKAALYVEILNNVKDRTWSSLMSMLGLASVLKAPISSIWPMTKDFKESFFNGTILLRVQEFLELEEIKILWFRCANVDRLAGKFVPNHFVPVVQEMKPSSHAFASEEATCSKKIKVDPSKLVA